MSDIRVRFAPSPTGNLHVGSARTAIFNWLFARHHQGTFILRIEDTDQERSKPEYTRAILDGLRWLGVDWDEGPEAGGDCGPYFQSRRRSFYDEALQRLRHEGKVYPCFCTPERLQDLRTAQLSAKQNPRYDGRCLALADDEVAQRIAAGEPFALRIKAARLESVEWTDLCKGLVSIGPEMLDDIVVAKSDGYPTYNFAVVVDDITMGISHVIRGEDHISNTPKQILIYRALGATPPRFAHIPMILGEDRSKMSKRHGSTNVVEYERQGYLSEAFFNFMTLLGWSPSDDQEIFTRDEVVRRFSLDRVSPSGAIFDINKLKWMNGMYIRQLSPAEMLDRAEPFLSTLEGYPGDYSREQRVEIARQLRERIELLTEITDAAGYFFHEPAEYDEKGLAKAAKTPDLAAVMEDLAAALATTEPFDEAGIEAAVRQLAEARGMGAGKVIHPTRLALSGRIAGPGLFEMMHVLGRARCVTRLRRFVERHPWEF
ncbi:MAG: glutamate--tRNA ligase [Acidobacteria bacterium]|nr:glutamate--tRNA ligase [Acidobacteriota bacterium]